MLWAAELMAELTAIMERCEHCREEFEIRNQGLSTRDYNLYYEWTAKNKYRCVA